MQRDVKKKKIVISLNNNSQRTYQNNKLMTSDKLHKSNLTSNEFTMPKQNSFSNLQTFSQININSNLDSSLKRFSNQARNFGSTNLDNKDLTYNQTYFSKISKNQNSNYPHRFSTKRNSHFEIEERYSSCVHSNNNKEPSFTDNIINSNLLRENNSAHINRYDQNLIGNISAYDFQEKKEQEVSKPIENEIHSQKNIVCVEVKDIENKKNFKKLSKGQKKTDDENKSDSKEEGFEKDEQKKEININKDKINKCENLQKNELGNQQVQEFHLNILDNKTFRNVANLENNTFKTFSSKLLNPSTTNLNINQGNKEKTETNLNKLKVRKISIEQMSIKSFKLLTEKNDFLVNERKYTEKINNNLEMINISNLNQDFKIKEQLLKENNESIIKNIEHNRNDETPEKIMKETKRNNIYSERNLINNIELNNDKKYKFPSMGNKINKSTEKKEIENSDKISELKKEKSSIEKIISSKKNIDEKETTDKEKKIELIQNRKKREKNKINSDNKVRKKNNTSQNFENINNKKLSKDKKDKINLLQKSKGVITRDSFSNPKEILLTLETLTNFSLVNENNNFNKKTKTAENEEVSRIEKRSNSINETDTIKNKSMSKSKKRTEKIILKNKIKELEKLLLIKDEKISKLEMDLTIVEAEKKGIRETFQNMNEQMQLNKRKMKNYKNMIEVLEKEVEDLRQKNEENQVQMISNLKKNEEIIKNNEILLVQNNFLKRNFSIISNVHNNDFRKFSQISDDILNLSLLESNSVHKTILSKDDLIKISKNDSVSSLGKNFRKIANMNNIQNVKEFLMSQFKTKNMTDDKTNCIQSPLIPFISNFEDNAENLISNKKEEENAESNLVHKEIDIKEENQEKYSKKIYKTQDNNLKQSNKKIFENNDEYYEDFYQIKNEESQKNDIFIEEENSDFSNIKLNNIFEKINLEKSKEDINWGKKNCNFRNKNKSVGFKNRLNNALKGFSENNSKDNILCKIIENLKNQNNRLQNQNHQYQKKYGNLKI